MVHRRVRGTIHAGARRTSRLDAQGAKAAGDATVTTSRVSGPHRPSLRCRRRHTLWSLLKSDADTGTHRPPIFIRHHRLRVRKRIPRRPGTKNRIEAAKISKKKSSRGSARKRKALCIPSGTQAVPPRKNKDEKRKPHLVSEDRLRPPPRECGPFFC
jgi:hypothetical protein